MELQNKQEFSEAALKFEVQKLEIHASADVQKAFAAAVGQMLSQAQRQIFGDPTTLSDMTSRFMKAAGWGQSFNGLRAALPAEATETAAKVLSGTGQTLSALVEKATGKRLDPELIEQTVRRVVEERLRQAAERACASWECRSGNGDAPRIREQPKDSPIAPRL